jgi:hypothetical protein
VTLGERPYPAMRALYALPVLPFASAVETDDGFPLNETTRFLPLYHTVDAGS